MLKEVINPLDCIEDILLNQNWVFDRPEEDKLTVNISGKNGQYAMEFIWDEFDEAMRFCCRFEIYIDKKAMSIASRAIQRANSNLWIGHFVIDEETLMPCFRHTSLFRGWNEHSEANHIADLIQIALDECEKHHAIFDLISSSNTFNDCQLNLALMNTQGEA
jgi:hypothetical protein